MNNAYSFLGIKVNTETATQIFNDADKDKDGFITYKEYFEFMKACIAKVEKLSEIVPVDNTKLARSYLRDFLWRMIRIILTSTIRTKAQPST